MSKKICDYTASYCDCNCKNVKIICNKDKTQCSNNDYNLGKQESNITLQT